MDLRFFIPLLVSFGALLALLVGGGEWANKREDACRDAVVPHDCYVRVMQEVLATEGPAAAMRYVEDVVQPNAGTDMAHMVSDFNFCALVPAEQQEGCAKAE